MKHPSFSIGLLLSIVTLSVLPAYAQTDWKIIDSAFGRKYSDLSCASSDDCMLTGSINDRPKEYNFRSIVHHTTDGGKSWRVVLTDSVQLPPNQHLPLLYHFIAHPTANLAIVAADSGTIMRSDDAGKTWNRISIADSTKKFVEIDMPTEQFGVIAQLPRSIFLTTDQGLTWKKLALPDTINNLVIDDVASPKPGMIIAKYNNVPQTMLTVISIDSGQNWQVYPAGTLDAGGFYFYNDVKGWACGIMLDSATSIQGEDVIYRTTDGGKTWKEQLRKRIQPNYGIYDFDFFDEENGIAVGGGGKILRTTNGGEEWVQETNPIPVTQFPSLIGVNFKSPDKALTATWTGIVLEWQKGVATIGEENQVAPFTQLLPNPASNQLTLHLELPKQALMEAVLYDMIGQKVCTIAQPHYANAGTHTISASVADLPAGVYYCQLLLGSQKVIRPVVIAR